MIEEDILGKLLTSYLFAWACVSTHRGIYTYKHTYTHTIHTHAKGSGEKPMTMLESLEETVRFSFTCCFSGSLGFNAHLGFDLYAVELTEVPIN